MTFDAEIKKLEQRNASGELTDQEFADAVMRLVRPPLHHRLILGAFIPFAHMFFARRAGGWGFFALLALLFVLGYQITPGREWVNLGWSVEVYYLVAGAVGAIAGFLGGQRRSVAAVAVAITGVASLWLIGLSHQWLPKFLLNQVVGWVGVVTIAIGLVPGVLLYAVCDRLLPALPDELAERYRHGRCPNPECKSLRGWDGQTCRFCGAKAHASTSPGASGPGPEKPD